MQKYFNTYKENANTMKEKTMFLQIWWSQKLKMESACSENVDLLDLGTLKFGNLETLKFGNLEIWHFET